MSTTKEEAHHNDMSMFGKVIVDRLKKLRIFIWGTQPLGAEIARNVVYFSIDHLVVYDQEKVTYSDLAGSSFAREGDITDGLTRATVAQKWLKSISNSCDISVCEEFHLEESLQDIDLFILTQLIDEEEMIKINKYCRDNSKGFIMAGTYGLYCFGFVDFGINHKLHDRDGEDTYPFLIQSISKANPGVVSLINQHKHPFCTGDFVRITEVEGMYQVNGVEPRPVKVIDEFSFSIEDTSFFAAYKKGGFAELVKVPSKMKFDSLESVILGSDPKIMNNKYKNVKILHLFWRSLIKYKQVHRKLPELLSEESYQLIFEIAKALNAENKEKQPGYFLEEIDEKQLRLLSKYTSVQLAPLTIGWAGLMSKEILSFCGKFEPIQQLFHLDFFEVSPKTDITLDEISEFANTRYYSQAALIGQQAMKKLFNFRVGLMGAGSNGCELARNLVLMGACSGDNGLMDILDQDTFKQFNVGSHQWITEQSVDKIKVEVVQQAINKLNPNIKVRCTQKLADKSSENDLGEDYWQNMDVIFNCTDKKVAKAYLLEKSLWYNKVLIDQSLDALKGATHSVIPNISDIPDLQKNDFISGRFDFDKDVIMNYPYLQVHDIIWAKEIFEQLFVENIRELKQYLNHPQQYIHQYQALFKLNMNYRTKLLIIHCMVTQKQRIEFKDIVQLSKEIFDLYYNERILRLVSSHIPADNSEEEKFWIGYKRVPQIISFNPENKAILRFITIVTQLYCNLFNLEISPEKISEESVKKILQTCYKNNSDDGNTQHQYWFLQSHELKDEKDIENFEKILQDCAKPAYIPELKIGILNQQSTSEHFREKYIEFLDIASNLRSFCYGHGKIQTYKVENIAFEMNRRSLFPQSIITSMAALELYKYAMEKDISDYRNIQFNLTQNQFDFIPPKKAKILSKDSNAVFIPKPFTVWEKIVINKPVSLEELISAFSRDYDITINSIYVNNVQVWQSNPLESKDDLNVLKMNLLEAFEFESGTKACNGTTLFLVMLTAKNKLDQPVVFPPIKYIHQKQAN